MPPGRSLIVGGGIGLFLIVALWQSVSNDKLSAAKFAKSAGSFSDQPLDGVTGHGRADKLMTASLSGHLRLACAYVSGELIDVSFVVPRGNGVTFVGPDISEDPGSLATCPVMK